MIVLAILAMIPLTADAKGKGGGGSHGGHGGYGGGHSGGGHGGNGAGGASGSASGAASDGASAGDAGSGGGSDGGGMAVDFTGTLPPKHVIGDVGHIPGFIYGKRSGTLFLTPNQEYTWDVFHGCKDTHGLMVSLDRLAFDGSFSFWANGGMFNVTRLKQCMEAHGFKFN
jgi:hypothetical protein